MSDEIFLLGPSSVMLTVCSYLGCYENQKNSWCRPSYKVIGGAVGMSQNTVSKYVCELEDRQLISAENTTNMTKDDLERNGNRLYIIRPIQFTPGQFYEQQLEWRDTMVERQRVAKALALRGDKERPA